MVPYANWHHSTSEPTKCSTYQQQCIGSTCSLLGMEMTTATKLVEFSFLSPICLLMSLNAEVFVVLVVVTVCRAPDHRFPLSAATHTASLRHWMPERGYQNNFQEIVLWYRLIMFCQNCVTCPSIRTEPWIHHLGSHHLGTWLCLIPRFRDPGSILILGQVAQYGNRYLICIT